MTFDLEAGEIFCVDKPLGWTSFDVVKKLRGAGKIKKIGHAGTLDPLATGLLICCTGKLTKQIESIQSQPKEYVAEIALGQTSPSFDLETELSEPALPTAHITKEQVQAVLVAHTGEQEQVPPLYSAVMIDGQRAYKIARAGREAELKAKPITIHELELLDYTDGVVRCRIRCSKGTYVRSLARDLGLALKNQAYLKSLRRSRIGQFSVENCWQVDHLAATLKQARQEALSSPAGAAES